MESAQRGGRGVYRQGALVPSHQPDRPEPTGHGQLRARCGLRAQGQGAGAVHYAAVCPSGMYSCLSMYISSDTPSQCRPLPAYAHLLTNSIGGSAHIWAVVSRREREESLRKGTAEVRNYSLRHSIFDRFHVVFMTSYNVYFYFYGICSCIPSKSSSGSSSSGTKTGGGETPTALACGRSGQVASVATTTPPPPPSAKTTTTNAATTASSAANTITSAPAASNPSGSPPGPNASSMLLKALKGGGSLTPTASDPVVVTAATATAATGGAMSPSGIRPPNAAPSPSNTTTFPHQTVCKAGSAVLPSEAYDFASRLIAPSDLRGYVRKFPKY